MILIIDTDVIVAGIRGRSGASAEVIRRVLSGQLVLAATVALILEYEAVATRPEHLAAAALGEREILNLIDSLAARAQPIELNYRWRPQLRDPDDEMVLEAAANGGGLPIVTFNRRDFRLAAARFGVELLLPGDILRRM